MKSLCNAVWLGVAIVLVSGGLIIGPALAPGQSAAATEKTMYMEVGGYYCDGCCSVHNILCCPETECVPDDT